MIYMKRLLSCFKGHGFQVILAPTFKLLEAILELFIPLIVASIINDGIVANDKMHIVYMFIIMFLCGFIGLAFSIVGQYFSAKSAVRASTKLRYELFEHLQNLTFSDIDKLGTSSMITRMTNDINQIQTGVNLTLRLFLRSPFVVFGAAIFASVVCPSMAYIFWITIPVLSVVIFGIILITLPLHKKVQKRLDNVLKQTRENLTGTRVIRAFTSEDEEIDEYFEKTKQLEKSQNKVTSISNLMNPLTYIIINVAIIILIYVGALRVESGLILQGTVIALYNYMSQILVELIKFANLIVTITKSLASLKRVESILNIDSKVDVICDNNIYNNSYISYDNVSMKYYEDSEYALTNITFNVNKGDTIGIIGGTGSGKTTLINLLTRYYRYNKGNIYFEGRKIESYTPNELNEKIGIVLQKAVLFKGTIKDNISFGKNITDEDIYKACDISMCLDVVKSKQDGINSVVEQHGSNFSGGQRQRLSIARVIARKPEILILDDSSSALDFQTEAKLRKNIMNLDYKPTTFIISQRTSSIQHATKILVLDDGNLVGVGTHEELLLNCDVYREIYESQFKKED